MIKDINWVSIYDPLFKVKGIITDTTLIKFDTEEICLFYENWPFAEATHFSYDG